MCLEVARGYVSAKAADLWESYKSEPHPYREMARDAVAVSLTSTASVAGGVVCTVIGVLGKVTDFIRRENFASMYLLPDGFGGLIGKSLYLIKDNALASLPTLVPTVYFVARRTFGTE